MKKSVFIILLILIILIIPIVHGGFFEWITGKATTATTSLNITISNTAPIIYNVTTVSTQSITEAGNTSVTFNFAVSDPDGTSTLNATSTLGAFNRTSHTTRSNSSCVSLGDLNATTRRYECTVLIWWFDGAGTWTVNASIEDNSGSLATNTSTTFTISPTRAFVMSPSSLTWPTISLGATNSTSNNDPIQMNNTGNDNVTTNGVQVTAIDLRGETNATEFLNVTDFSMNITTGGSPAGECSGVIPTSNNTATNITTSILPAGNYTLAYANETSGQEQVYFCLVKITSGAHQQSYSTSVGGSSWTLAI